MPCAGHMEGRLNPCPPAGYILERETPNLENVTQAGPAVSGSFPLLHIIQTSMCKVHTPEATPSALWGCQKVKDHQEVTIFNSCSKLSVEIDMGQIILRPPDLLTPPARPQTRKRAWAWIIQNSSQYNSSSV